MSSRAKGRLSGATLPTAPNPPSIDPYPLDDSDESLCGYHYDYDSDAPGHGTTRKRKRGAQNKEELEEAKRRRAEARAEIRYGKPPPVPDLSDDGIVDYDQSEDEDNGLWSTKRAKPSTEAAIGVRKGLAECHSSELNSISYDLAGINLNVTLGDLLKSHLGVPGMASTNVVLGRKINHPHMDMAGDKPTSDIHVNKPSFLDLPPEVRVQIYRFALRGECAVDFGRRTNFSRSSALLRTCKQVHEEGRGILYGENSFHFARSSEVRGRYWEPDWKEIGYDDVRRFLETIGPINFSHIKYVSFLLTDASVRNSPQTSIDERRYVNDASLQQVFRLIGAHTTLRKLAVMFGGRAKVVTADYHFLKAFTEMKCHEFILLGVFRGYTTKFQDNLRARMQSVMVVPFEFDDKNQIHPKLINKNRVSMVYEEAGAPCPGTYLSSMTT
ncbi:hypothetical protein A1O3_03405 [Capronia epimyces CBS 606.96]|uniref:Uncharacterized protein n=1 Tax=Capronia epimyces CBS 606.96 TaxID=1182542 RepID=W9YVZ8_9EURO|nr:uncharacterized protein A1O3_03405 [Capronia epimyces CBS 606.96]EXJ86454.1 hypothetical protein A1O3_03405 [Capronia epimyces CBS 606.96]